MPLIRMRHPVDTPPLLAVLASVHHASSYPLRWPADPVAWLTPPSFLTSWVAVEDEAVLGHVALLSAPEARTAAPWMEATGLPPDRLAELAKLFVAPEARGQGLGSALLEAAAGASREWGLRPVLEVLDNNCGAIALYERAGWQRVASVPVSWAQGDEGPLPLHYYVGPA